jgi:hypothetical protein
MSNVVDDCLNARAAYNKAQAELKAYKDLIKNLSDILQRGSTPNVPEQWPDRQQLQTALNEWANTHQRWIDAYNQLTPIQKDGVKSPHDGTGPTRAGSI